MRIALVFLCACAATSPNAASPKAAASEVVDDGTCQNWPRVNVLMADGHNTIWPVRCDLVESRENEIIKADAARLLDCAASNIIVEKTGDQYAWVARGCAKRTAFFTYTAAYGESRLVPGFEGKNTQTSLEMLCSLTKDDAQKAKESADQLAVSLRLQYNQPSLDEQLGVRQALMAQATKDLSCPDVNIVPELIYTSSSIATPTAEGCGKRAVYLPGPHFATTFRLASLVNIQ